MKYNIKRISQCDETSCASANYTMVANALGFDLSLHDILKITSGTLGQAQFWNWCLEQGIKIKCISKNDYRTFPQGAPEWVKNFFAQRSNGMEDFAKVLNNPNFEFKNRAPTEADLRKLFDDRYVVEIMGDGWMMYGDKPEEQLLHRVFITDIDGDDVYFHDPAADGVANHKAKMSDIMAALSVDGAEIIGYKNT